MNTVEIIFSPTGGTEKVADIISGCWSETVTKIDLSDAKTDYSKCSINKDDQEKAGYYGEKIVLKCQELGLNTCWVAITHG